MQINIESFYYEDDDYDDDAKDGNTCLLCMLVGYVKF